MLRIGQSLECWRAPLADAVARRDSLPLFARARRQLVAGAEALDVNFGARPRPGLTEDMRWTAIELRAALPDVPLFLDCGDLDALASVLPAVASPLVVNALPLGSTADAPRRLLEAAAVTQAGVVFSPGASAESDTPDAILSASEAAAMLAGRAGLRGPLYIDCLAYPAASHPARCRGSLAWLRTLRATGDTRLLPLVAVGNVAHGASDADRAALLLVYAASAVAAGAQALIVPVEEVSVMSLIDVMTTVRGPATALERWARALMDEAGARTPPPGGRELRTAWELLAP